MLTDVMESKTRSSHDLVMTWRLTRVGGFLPLQTRTRPAASDADCDLGATRASGEPRTTIRSARLLDLAHLLGPRQDVTN
jgi:hypothetical protein